MAKTNHKSSNYDTEAKLREVVDGLSATFQSLTDNLHGEGEHPSVVADIARIGTALTSALAELRQHAKADRRALASFSVDQILDHLRTLPITERLEIAETLSGARDGEALL